MKSKHIIAIVVALIGIIGGGTAYQINIDMSTNIDQSETNISGDTNISGTVVNIDGEGITCEQLNQMCQETNVSGALESACNIIGILCPG